MGELRVCNNYFGQVCQLKLTPFSTSKVQYSSTCIDKPSILKGNNLMNPSIQSAFKNMVFLKFNDNDNNDVFFVN